MLEINSIAPAESDLIIVLSNSHPGKLGCNQTSTPWTNEQLIRALALWAEGKSSTEVASALNKEFGTSHTRNAVIGKIHRANPIKRVHKNPGGVPKKPKAWMAPDVPEITDLAIPFAQRKTFIQLERGDCRFPVGHPDEADFFFCGAQSVAFAPYCAGHAKRCYGKF